MKWAVGLCNLAGEPTEIATPRQVGARSDKGEPHEIVAASIDGAGCLPPNDKGTWCWVKKTAARSWRRDLDEPVSSLFLGLTSRTTISAYGAFSTGRVPVGRGR